MWKGWTPCLCCAALQLEPWPRQWDSTGSGSAAAARTARPPPQRVHVYSATLGTRSLPAQAREKQKGPRKTSSGDEIKMLNSAITYLSHLCPMLVRSRGTRALARRATSAATMP